MAKKYEELTIADDFMFCKVMTNNPEQCRMLAELAIGRKVGGIVTIGKQVPIEITNDGRGVRFDVYMEDDCRTIYNIEMQAGSIKDLPLRTRYYQGMIDLDQMERGSRFEDLKNCFIIFVCLDNLFPDYGFHKYSFRSTCAEVPRLEFGDRSHKIILSAKGTQDDIPEELKAFLDYISGHVPRSDYTRQLDSLVNKARDHIEWRKEYMTLLERDERMREEGRKEGREEGRKKGREEGLKEGRKEGLKEGREEEHVNTVKESKRADAAEKKVAELSAQIERLKAQIP